MNPLTSVTGKHYNKYEQIVLETCSINGKAVNIQSQGDSHLCGMCEINNTLSDLNYAIPFTVTDFNTTADKQCLHHAIDYEHDFVHQEIESNRTLKGDYGIDVLQGVVELKGYACCRKEK